MPEIDLFRIRRAATEVLALLLIRRPEDIDLDVLAYQLGATVFYKPLANAEGMLIRSGKSALIYVDPSVGGQGRVRFAVAHEIGHLKLHVGQTQAWLCEDSPSAMGDYHNSQQEIEANMFAAHLLMPSRMFAADAARSAFCVSGIERLAELYRTSFIATARRFVDESRDSLMVIMSEARRVKWWHTSGRVNGFYLRRDQHVPTESDASDCQDGRPGNSDLTEIESTVWFPDLRRHRVLEQSLRLGGYPWVITLVEAEALEDDW
ncbi:MAG: ImmA/IrrE family metallo-endopeptidase [Candidatus Sumerlaeia bacterium]|nr:ImmA/IrrE family metallo-endopeptidase [Candidatus Sumerlaeia bacterium]